MVATLLSPSFPFFFVIAQHNVVVVAFFFLFVCRGSEEGNDIIIIVTFFFLLQGNKEGDDNVATITFLLLFCCNAMKKAMTTFCFVLTIRKKVTVMSCDLLLWFHCNKEEEDDNFLHLL